MGFWNLFLMPKDNVYKDDDSAYGGSQRPSEQSLSEEENSITVIPLEKSVFYHFLQIPTKIKHFGLMAAILKNPHFGKNAQDDFKPFYVEDLATKELVRFQLLPFEKKPYIYVYSRNIDKSAVFEWEDLRKKLHSGVTLHQILVENKLLIDEKELSQYKNKRPGTKI